MLLRPKSPPVAGTQKQDLNVIFTAHVFPLPCLYVGEEDFPLQWMNVCVLWGSSLGLTGLYFGVAV